MYYFGFKGGTKTLPPDSGGNTSAIKFFLFTVEGYQELIHTRAKAINIIREESYLTIPPIINYIASNFRSVQTIPVYSSIPKLVKVFYSETINGRSVFYIPIYVELSDHDDKDAFYIEISPLDADIKHSNIYKFWGIGRIKKYKDVLNLLPEDSISYKILKNYKKPPTKIVRDMIKLQKMSDIWAKVKNPESDRTKILIRL